MLRAVGVWSLKSNCLFWGNMWWVILYVKSTWSPKIWDTLAIAEFNKLKWSQLVHLFTFLINFIDFVDTSKYFYTRFFIAPFYLFLFACLLVFKNCVCLLRLQDVKCIVQIETETLAKEKPCWNWCKFLCFCTFEVGSYFGAELCSLDVDSDGNTDFLLVGAPLFYQPQQKTEGQIHVYTLTAEVESDSLWNL